MSSYIHLYYMWNMCITGVSHMHYRCMNVECYIIFILKYSSKLWEWAKCKRVNINSINIIGANISWSTLCEGTVKPSQKTETFMSMVHHGHFDITPWSTKGRSTVHLITNYYRREGNTLSLSEVGD